MPGNTKHSRAPIAYSQSSYFFIKSEAPAEFCQNFKLIGFFYRRNFQNYHGRSTDFAIFELKLQNFIQVFWTERSKSSRKLHWNLVNASWFLPKSKLNPTFRLHDAYPVVKMAKKAPKTPKNQFQRDSTRPKHVPRELSRYWQKDQACGTTKQRKSRGHF